MENDVLHGDLKVPLQPCFSQTVKEIKHRSTQMWNGRQELHFGVDVQPGRHLEIHLLDGRHFFKWQVGSVTYQTTRECFQKIIPGVRFDLSVVGVVFTENLQYMYSFISNALIPTPQHLVQI